MESFKRGGEGSCFGDSGGPLVVFNTEGNSPFHVQVGVVRGAAGECGSEHFPDIYARLDDFKILRWILQKAFGQRIREPQRGDTLTSSSLKENCRHEL